MKVYVIFYSSKTIQEVMGVYSSIQKAKEVHANLMDVLAIGIGLDRMLVIIERDLE
jgi:hypothetical protein